ESEESSVDEFESDLEEEEQNEQEVQELNMVVDVYKELMKNIVDVDFSTIEFKYQHSIILIIIVSIILMLYD
ncbi:hypothetical protein BDZ91DRAFT_723406, partial [Kalaharituber pfeilii]